MALETSRDAGLKSIGNYDLLEKIAEGGMGAIYRGRNRETGQVVAVKIMPPHTASNPTLLERFAREFRAALKLDHPNIVRAIDFCDSPPTPYLVMEFVDGESLGQRLERAGRLTQDEAIRIIAQVAQGLHRAHKLNLVHRDVKPDNILITRDNVAKLADLGLVKETETDLNLTKTGRGLGTPHFMAPEQFRDAKSADIRCDIYSLGATLYQMLTGELPFKSNGPLDAWMKKINHDLKPPRELAPELSERVEWAILRAMDPEKENRPASCREFIEDLTGHSTRRTNTQIGATPTGELWYLVYKDELNVSHTVKGTTPAIRRSLKEGLLGDASNIRASRSKGGPFEALRSFPEFRDLVINLGGSPAASPTQPPAAIGKPSSSGRIIPPKPTPATSERSGRRAGVTRVTPKSPSEQQEENRPHFTLGESGERIQEESGGDWVKWLFLLILFLGSAVVAFWLMHGRKLPWF